MTTWHVRPPEETDYAPYYATYVSKVPQGNVIETLQREVSDTVSMLRDIPHERADHRYAEGKWSIKEVIGHVLDAERVFAIRCLAFARADPNPWPGMEQDIWVDGAQFDHLSLPDLTNQFEHCRRANVSLFQSLTDEQMARRGTASGVEFTARAFPYIIAGHEIHHKRVLRERYL